MRFEKAFIPYGGYWSTPFCKWQGSLSTFNSIELAGQAARKALAERDIPAGGLDAIVLGTTVPQKHGLFGGADREMMSPADLRAYIEREKHLPGIPSAEEIRREGLNLSRFQMNLLQKIEELTLFTLTQQEEIDKLEARLQEIEPEPAQD